MQFSEAWGLLRSDWLSTFPVTSELTVLWSSPSYSEGTSLREKGSEQPSGGQPETEGWVVGLWGSREAPRWFVVALLKEGPST